MYDRTPSRVRSRVIQSTHFLPDRARPRLATSTSTNSLHRSDITTFKSPPPRPSDVRARLLSPNSSLPAFSPPPRVRLQNNLRDHLRRVHVPLRAPRQTRLFARRHRPRRFLHAQFKTSISRGCEKFLRPFARYRSSISFSLRPRALVVARARALERRSSSSIHSLTCAYAFASSALT